MKTITLIFALLVLSSCNDALRTRIGKCKSANNQLVICGTQNALKSEDYRNKLIAEITTPIVVGKNRLTLKEEAHDSAFGNEYNCDLDIYSKQFNYSIENEILSLKDGLSTLTFKRMSGFTSDGIIGEWEMEEKTEHTLYVTQLTFRDLEEVRITKTCNFK